MIHYDLSWFIVNYYCKDRIHSAEVKVRQCVLSGFECTDFCSSSAALTTLTSELGLEARICIRPSSS